MSGGVLDKLGGLASPLLGRFGPQALGSALGGAGGSAAKASWRDQLQMASFRGVPFQVDSIDWTAGDNVVIREYPFQDLPTVFRMGRSAEEIKLSAYVIGDDYHLQRTKLAEALTGEGMLMHPTAGQMRVFVAGKFTIKENPTAEGGMARFDLTFIRADSRRYPSGVANTQGEAASKAVACKQAAADAFVASWLLKGKPGWVADLALGRIAGSLTAVWGQLSGATKNLGDFTSGIIGQYTALRTGLNDLVSAPRLLADSLVNLFALPADLSNAAARDFQAAFGWAFDLSTRLQVRDFEVVVMPPVGTGLVMYGTGNAAVLGLDSPARAQLGNLTAASDQLFETLATAGYVQATAALDLGNYDEALQMRGAVAAQVKRLMARASAQPASQDLPATSWHDAMLGLQTAALGDLQARSRDLVRLTYYTPEGWQPVWYISYRLFGTAAYADEILGMNPHITHPLLVPPGVRLRIVRHD